MTDEVDNQVAPPLPAGVVSEQIETRAIADQPPPVDFVRSVIARVELHVAAGNWAVAFRTLESARSEWEEQQLEQRSARRRLPAEWLRRPISEMGLSMRLTSTFERAGAVTIADCLAIVADPARHPPGVGKVMLGEVSDAARRLGLMPLRAAG